MSLQLCGPVPPIWFSCDGCTFSPDGLPLHGINWKEACRWHDWAYTIGVPISRQEADRNFFNNLKKLGCPTRLAWAYWLAVRVFGWRHFHRQD